MASPEDEGIERFLISPEWLEEFDQGIKELIEKFDERGVPRAMMLAALSRGCGKLMAITADQPPEVLGLCVQLNVQGGYQEVIDVFSPLANPKGSA